MDKLLEDPSIIEGCYFNYKSCEGNDINFCYMFATECFTLIENNIPVSFRFSDDNNVEVIIDKEDKLLVDYTSLFYNLKTLLVEYSIIEFISNCYSLDESKLKFIEDNVYNLSLLVDSEGRELLDITLSPSNESKTSLNEIESSSLDNSIVSLKSKYDTVIIKLNDSLLDLGFELNIGITVSKNQGLMLVLRNLTSGENSSSVINLLLDELNNCIISNFKLEGLPSLVALKILKCFDELGELEFIDTLIYLPNTCNLVYKLLYKLNYYSNEDYVVPKSPMIRNF